MAETTKPGASRRNDRLAEHAADYRPLGRRPAQRRLRDRPRREVAGAEDAAEGIVERRPGAALYHSENLRVMVLLLLLIDSKTAAI